jgi:mono/diheme cytochrome c family protein
MKQFTFLTAGLIATLLAVGFISCSNGNKVPGKIYMPDMTYSRAVESYALLDSTVFTTDAANRGNEIFYNRKPVEGTIKRGELFPYTLPNDSAGYVMSADVKNPLPPLTGKDSAETARLFNVYCAICHGIDGKASGPLSTSGKIGAVANFTLDVYVKMADGTMFHSINYGKNNMGSYASQLDRKQRWQLVHYIRTLQPKPEANAAATATTETVAKTDSASTKKAK